VAKPTEIEIQKARDSISIAEPEAPIAFRQSNPFAQLM
jgi:hypothetical protein